MSKSDRVLFDIRMGPCGDFLSLQIWQLYGVSRLGDFSEEVPPVPIPNTVVKLLSADDTATRWESRSLPGLCPVGGE